jgi:hypothetical protein
MKMSEVSKTGFTKERPHAPQYNRAHITTYSPMPCPVQCVCGTDLGDWSVEAESIIMSKLIPPYVWNKLNSNTGELFKTLLMMMMTKKKNKKKRR